MSSTQYVDVESYLRRLDDGNLHPTNVDAIRSFIDHCAAEGISEVRQERLASALKSILVNLAPNAFQLTNASEQEIKRVVAVLNRSDYAQSTKHTFRSALKKFYKVENGGHKEPGKTKFFAVGKPGSTVSREDIFTKDELKGLLRSFSSTRDRALTLMLYESAARPGEMLSRNIGDFTAN